jgi:hypothetical protein
MENERDTLLFKIQEMQGKDQDLPVIKNFLAEQNKDLIQENLKLTQDNLELESDINQFLAGEDEEIAETQKLKDKIKILSEKLQEMSYSEKPSVDSAYSLDIDLKSNESGLNKKYRSLENKL